MEEHCRNQSSGQCVTSGGKVTLTQLLPSSSSHVGGAIAGCMIHKEWEREV